MIDIHIYAVKSRKDNVDKLLKAIPEAIVHWDTFKGLPVERYHQNCKAAWLAPMDGITHRIVLADDAGVCDNFLKIAQKCADKFPDRIWSFCTQRQAEDDSPYSVVCSRFPMGVGMMIPAELIRPIFEPWNITHEQAQGTGWYTNTDETIVERYIIAHGLKLMTTNPNIVSHLEIGKSVLRDGEASAYSSASYKQKPSLKRFDSGEVGLTIA